MIRITPRLLSKEKSVDVCEIMIHSCFELLCKYVENELWNKGETFEDLKFRFRTIVENVRKLPEEEYNICYGWCAENSFTAIELYEWWQNVYTPYYNGDKKFEWMDNWVGEDFPEEKTDVKQFEWIQIETNYNLLTLMEIRESLWS